MRSLVEEVRVITALRPPATQEDALHNLTVHRAVLGQGRRPLTGALLAHHRMHLEAELTWTRAVLESVERGACEAELEDMRVAAQQGHRGA